MQNEWYSLDAALLGLVVISAVLGTLFFLDIVLRKRHRRSGGPPPKRRRRSRSTNHVVDSFELAMDREPEHRECRPNLVLTGDQQLHVRLHATAGDGVRVRTTVAVHYRLLRRSNERVCFEPSKITAQIASFFRKSLQSHVANVGFAELPGSLGVALAATQRAFCKAAIPCGLEVTDAYVVSCGAISGSFAELASAQSRSGHCPKEALTDGSTELQSSTNP